MDSIPRPNDLRRVLSAACQENPSSHDFLHFSFSHASFGTMLPPFEEYFLSDALLTLLVMVAESSVFFPL